MTMSSNDTEETSTKDDNDTETSPDDVTSIITSLGSTKLKLAVFLFIIFIIINSDVFVDKVLSTKSETFAIGRSITTKGVIAQGAIVSVCYILLSVLVENEYI